MQRRFVLQFRPTDDSLKIVAARCGAFGSDAIPTSFDPVSAPRSEHEPCEPRLETSHRAYTTVQSRSWPASRRP
jgi:hypothetical protein